MPVSNVAKATYHINGPQAGFSESYCFGDVSVSEAKTLAKNLWGFRKALLAKECFLVYASVSFLGEARDSWRLQISVPDEGVGGQTGLWVVDNLDVCNNISDSLHIRLQLENGNRANRHLRGVPDGFARSGALMHGIGDCNLRRWRRSAANSKLCKHDRYTDH